MRKAVSAQELAVQSIRNEEGKKSLTLHQALKQLTNSYLICKDCFENGNFPKVFKPEEFVPTTLRGLLNQDGADCGKEKQQEDQDGNAADQDEVNHEQDQAMVTLD